MILRATSDIAVAMSVSSLPENRSPDTSPRTFCRASTTSTCALIGTISSRGSLIARRFRDGSCLESVKAILQIERRHCPFEAKAELHHRKRHLRLDTNDDAFCSQQLDHLRDATQRADGKRIHHIEHRHVDD